MRHLPRIPGLLVTFRILSVNDGEERMGMAALSFTLHSML